MSTSALALARRASHVLRQNTRSYATKQTQIKSSCEANTVMPGLNYLKGQPPVTAKPDEEYPEWLWSITQPKVHPEDGPGGKKERVERRKANRQRIKDQNFMSTQ